jgi:phosphate transport system permease protein
MTQTKPNEDVSRIAAAPASAPEAPPPDLAPPTRHGQVRRLGDRVFSGSATTAGLIILVVLALVAAFLLVQGVPALTAPVDDLPYGPFLSFVLPLAFATVWAAFLALLMAVPVAIGIALFISHYAPRRLAAGLGT